MATLAPVAQRALGLQKSQAQVAALVMYQFAKVWASLDVDDLPGTLPQVTTMAQTLVQQWGQVAAVVAAEYYADERAQLRNLVSPFTPMPAETAPPEEVEKAVKWATKGLWSKTPDVEAAQVLTQGAVTKMALDPARETVIQSVKQDPAAIGWARITDGDPCAFCAMLASRGPVYKSEQQAGFEAHDHCKCSAAPFFSKDDAALLSSKHLYDEWKRVTHGHSGRGAIRAWRDYWDHGGRQENVPYLIAA